MVALNRDMGPIARLPSLGELLAAVLDALPAPRTPLAVEDVPHQVGLPEARLQHALLCMAAAEGGMSLVLTISLHHVKDAVQQQRQYAPQLWVETARRWLHVEDVPPIHTVGEADMGKLVVLVQRGQEVVRPRHPEEGTNSGHEGAHATALGVAVRLLYLCRPSRRQQVLCTRPHRPLSPWRHAHRFDRHVPGVRPQGRASR